MADVGQFAYHVVLRRTAGSDAMNGGRGRWQHLRSAGAIEAHLLGAGEVSLVNLARRAEAVDGLI